MINYKRLLSLAVILPMTLSLVSCGKSNSVKYDPLPKEDDTVYNISLLQDEDNDYYNGIAQGFTDALNDLFGENHIKTSDKITADTQLIFATGRQGGSVYFRGKRFYADGKAFPGVEKT